MKIKISHVTSVHPRVDTRILAKECASLSDAGFDVNLVVADGKSSEALGDVTIRDVGESRGRLARATVTALRIGREVVRSGVQVFHFHDPELIPIAIALKIRGIKVIYDVHEDLPRQIMSKHWIPSWARLAVSVLMEGSEWVSARMFDGIVAATPTIAARFPAHKTVTVQNFPILAELHTPDPVPMHERPFQAAYVGGITGIRGAREMMMALELVPRKYELRLALGGTCTPLSLRDELVCMAGWQQVDELGWMDRANVASALSRSRMGLVVLHPTLNYPDAYPVKMFEYMSAGIPVIASDFPLWREIVDGAGCGLLIDPLNPQAIADAMQWLLDHPDEASAMGQRGRRSVEQSYNWEGEAEKLLDLYRRLLGDLVAEKRGGA